MLLNEKLNRILIKISGEFFSSSDKLLDMRKISSVSEDLCCINKQGIETGIVVGGGNICRGRDISGIDKIIADQAGMLSTVINGLVLSDVLRQKNVKVRVLSSVPMSGICELYCRSRALEYINSGEILIFVCGTGNPIFTTDTAAALRAVEMKCDVFLKGTHVPGVFSKDPRESNDAKHLHKVSYHDIMKMKLDVIDMSAASISECGNVPIVIFDINKKNSILDVIAGKGQYSVISDGG